MPDTHDSALTQGVETQFWRSHEIAQACAFVLPFQGAGGPAPAATHWQKWFYDFNVWTAGKRAEKLRYMHAIPYCGVWRPHQNCGVGAVSVPTCLWSRDRYESMRGKSSS